MKRGIIVLCLCIVAMAGCFYLRFRSGKWKTMRVIEAAPAA